MVTKQSKQEKRLAKGLAKQAAKAAALAADQLERNKDLQGAVPASTQEPEAGSEVAAELPELVPDATEGTPAVPSAADHVPPAELPAPTPAAGPVLHVKQGLALRGGRGEWYKLLCKYDGKPVAEYVAEGKANPASHYTARSTKCGQPKTPESRLSWFKRAGIVTIS